tara:strand:+ start:5469 stop:5591 length:123 start_codon:yes stop_codon:yes gene_type:complete
MDKQIFYFIAIVAVIAVVGTALVVTHEPNDNFENTRVFAK